MAGGTLTVNPGKAMQLSGAPIAVGSLIYNQDQNNAVWVGSDGTVSPGNGLRIPPLGSINWQNSAGQLWACVDSGVNAPVLIQVSSDGNTLNNPVEVATATASALFASGVPNVFTENTLYNNVLASTAYFNLDVHSYSSLLIDIVRADTNAIRIQVTTYPLPNQQGTPKSIFLTVPSDINVIKSIGSWQVPVTGASMTITNLDNTSLTGPALSIIGTNQPAPPKVLNLGVNNIPAYYAYTGPTTAATLIELAGQDTGSSSSNYTGKTVFNGPITVMSSNPAGGSAGYWVMRYLGVAANHDIYAPLQASGNRAQYNLSHPGVPCVWFFYPTATVATSLTYELWIIPT